MSDDNFKLNIIQIEKRAMLKPGKDVKCRHESIPGSRNESHYWHGLATKKISLLRPLEMWQKVKYANNSDDT